MWFVELTMQFVKHCAIQDVTQTNEVYESEDLFISNSS